LPLQSWLQSEINMLRHYSDRYLFFEHLVEENTPFWFSDFVERARSFDLVHVGDAEVSAGLTRQVGADGSRAITDRLATHGSAYEAHVEAQQMLDNLTLRHFRRSLLTHAAHIDRLVPEFDVDAVDGCFVSLERLRTNELGESEIELDVDAADGLEVSLDEDGRFVITSGDPVPIVAMWSLANSPRRGMTVDDLVSVVASQVDGSDVRRRVHEWALTTFLEGGVQLSRWPRPTAYEIPDRPSTSRCARWQASQLRTSVTNLRHEELEIDDLDRVLIVNMDGSRSVDEVVASGLVALTDGTVEVEVDGETVTDTDLLRELVETKIQRLVNRGLVLHD
jgi:methyltransferase-like protein